MPYESLSCLVLVWLCYSVPEITNKNNKSGKNDMGVRGTLAATASSSVPGIFQNGLGICNLRVCGNTTQPIVTDSGLVGYWSVSAGSKQLGITGTNILTKLTLPLRAS